MLVSRARAAEVVSTVVQNNSKSQQQVIECNGLENLLINFNFDDDMKVRTKALGAISCTILYQDQFSLLLYVCIWSVLLF